MRDRLRMRQFVALSEWVDFSTPPDTEYANSEGVVKKAMFSQGRATRGRCDVHICINTLASYMPACIFRDITVLAVNCLLPQWFFVSLKLKRNFLRQNFPILMQKRHRLTANEMVTLRNTSILPTTYLKSFSRVCICICLFV